MSSDRSEAISLGDARALFLALRSVSRRGAIARFAHGAERAAVVVLVLAALWVLAACVFPVPPAVHRALRLALPLSVAAWLLRGAWMAAREQVPARAMAVLWERACPTFDGCLIAAVEGAQGAAVPAAVLSISCRRAFGVMRRMPAVPPSPQARPFQRLHVALCAAFALHLACAIGFRGDYFRALAACLWGRAPAPRPALAFTEVWPGNAEIAEGEPLSIGARIEPEASAEDVLLVTDSWMGGEGIRAPLVRDELGRRVVQFPAILYSFRYRLTAGPPDDAPFGSPAARAAESPWFEVRVVPRVRALRFSARVTPPAYTGAPEETIESPYVEALWGSSVRFEVWTSHEDATGELAGPWGPSRALLSRSPGGEAAPGGTRMEGGIVARQGGAYEIRLTAPGRSGSTTIHGVLALRYDRPPTASCRIPEGAGIAAEGLPVMLRMADDFGLSRARLTLVRAGGRETSYDVPGVAGRREVYRAMYIPGEDLGSGETFEYFLEAWDSIPVTPQAARSSPQVFTVPKSPRTDRPLFDPPRQLRRPGRADDGLPPEAPPGGRSAEEDGGRPRSLRAGPERLEGDEDRQPWPGPSPARPGSGQTQPSDYQAPSGIRRPSEPPGGQGANEGSRGKEEGKKTDPRDSGNPGGQSGDGGRDGPQGRRPGGPRPEGGGQEGKESGGPRNAGDGDDRGRRPPPSNESGNVPGMGPGDAPTPGAAQQQPRDAGARTGRETGVGPARPETVDAEKVKPLDDVSSAEAAEYARRAGMKDLRKDFGSERKKGDASAPKGGPSDPGGNLSIPSALRTPARPGETPKGKPASGPPSDKLRTVAPEYRALVEQYLRRMEGR